MNGSKRLAASIVLALGSVSLAVHAQQVRSVSVELPADRTWEALSDTAGARSYNHEWIPAGSTYESADWLIAWQKVPLDDEDNPIRFLEKIYEISEEACNSAVHDEPRRTRINGYRVAVGRTMCAHRLGETFGSFSDRMVLIDNGFAYIVTSELRLPPMVVAGVLSFDLSESPNAAAEFRDREERSRQLVRERVVIE